MINSFYIIYSPSLDQYIDKEGMTYTEIDDISANGINKLDDAKALLSDFIKIGYIDAQIVRATIRVDIDEVLDD